MFKNRLVKYSIVGVTGTFIDLFLLYILVDIFSYSVISSAIVSFVFASTNNFLINQLWTFRDNLEGELDKTYQVRYIKFMIISIIGLCFTVFLMYVFNTIFLIWYILAKIMTSVVVLLWNYYANKNWTFRVR